MFTLDFVLTSDLVYIYALFIFYPFTLMKLFYTTGNLDILCFKFLVIAIIFVLGCNVFMQ